MSDDAARTPHERRRAPSRAMTGGRRLTDPAPDAFLTVPAFAKQLNVRDKTVRKWIHAGTLPAYQIEGEWRIKRADALKFIEDARFKPETPTHGETPESPEPEQDPGDGAASTG